MYYVLRKTTTTSKLLVLLTLVLVLLVVATQVRAAAVVKDESQLIIDEWSLQNVPFDSGAISLGVTVLDNLSLRLEGRDPYYATNAPKGATLNATLVSTTEIYWTVSANF